jgi:hypothetical protein
MNSKRNGGPLDQFLRLVLPEKWDTRLKSTYAMAVLFPVMATVYIGAPILALVLLSGMFGADMPTVKPEEVFSIWGLLAAGGAVIGFASFKQK